MFANWIEHTSSTGGAGNLTLAAIAGLPSFQDRFGSSGARDSSYTVQEWAGADHSGPPIKAEAGLGRVNLATLVLSRTKPLSTWDGTTYDAVGPTPISFGSTQANIRISVTPLAEISPEVLPYHAVAAPAADVGLPSAHAMINTSTRTLTANTAYFMAFLWLGCGEVTQVSMHCSTAVASSGVKLAIFEVGANGLPGRRLLNVNGGTALSTVATGMKSAAVSPGLYLPPDWYYAALVSGHAIGVRAMSPQSQLAPTGCANIGGPNTSLNASVTFTTGFAASAPASGYSNGGTSNGPAIYVKSRNT